jgi:hypothetical protein
MSAQARICFTVSWDGLQQGGLRFRLRGMVWLPVIHAFFGSKAAEMPHQSSYFANSQCIIVK